MDYHAAVKLAWERVQQGHGTQLIVGTEDNHYGFRVCQESSAQLLPHEYRHRTITSWPTPAETEMLS